MKKWKIVLIAIVVLLVIGSFVSSMMMEKGDTYFLQEYMRHNH